MTPHNPDVALSSSWRKRFDFFDTYGLPNSSPEAKAAFKALSFGARMQIGSNFLAFLFGPLYFFVKGMWRKGLTLLGLFGAVGVVMALVNAPDNWARAASIGVAAVAMNAANYAYYLHVTRGSRSWNLFEGFSRKDRKK